MDKHIKGRIHCILWAAMLLLFLTVFVQPALAAEDCTVIVGGATLWNGTYDAANFTPVYYKNGDTTVLTGSEMDYNAKLSYRDGFVLTLNGLNAKITGTDYNAYGIYVNTSITIELIGDNKISEYCTTFDASHIYLDSYHDTFLTICGSGSLSLLSDNDGTSVCRGIRATGGMQIKDCTLNIFITGPDNKYALLTDYGKPLEINNATIKISAYSESEYAYTQAINCGDLKINNSLVEAVVEGGSYSKSIYANNMIVSGNSKLLIKGSYRGGGSSGASGSVTIFKSMIVEDTATVTVENGLSGEYYDDRPSSALLALKDNAKLIATGGENAVQYFDKVMLSGSAQLSTTGSNCGLFVNNFTMYGGKVDATADEGHGIQADLVTVIDGQIVVNGKLNGIQSTGTMTVSNSADIQAKGGQYGIDTAMLAAEGGAVHAEGGRAGIKANLLNVINGAEVMAVGDEANADSCGVDAGSIILSGGITQASGGAAIKSGNVTLGDKLWYRWSVQEGGTMNETAFDYSANSASQYLRVESRPEGKTVSSIEKTSSSGLTDTYTISFSDGSFTTFTITNGRDGVDAVGIKSVEKTASKVNVDTYTITLTNGVTHSFTVTNGLDGKTPQLRINNSTKLWEVSYDGGATWKSLNISAASEEKQGADGKDGKDGKDGEDGLTPFIGENGNWWIGNEDTGIQATATPAPREPQTGVNVAFVVAALALAGNIALIGWILLKKK